MAIIGKVESLWRYPVKSMRGEELSEAFVGFAGIYGDRLRLLAFPVRARDGKPPRSDMRSPGSRARSVRTCQGLRPRWA